MDLLLKATHRVEQEHFWFRGLRRFLRPVLERAAGGRRDLRLIDCGSGTGVNLPLLARFGSVYNVDLSTYGVTLARQSGFPRGARASVAHLPFADRTFDVATSIDVLYCLDDGDERRAVGEMYRVLKPGGAAVFNLAAMPILRGDHSVLAQEVRRYDRPRVRALLTEAGFRVERLRYTNALLFPLVLGQRTLQRLLGFTSPDTTAHDWRVPSRPVNATLAAVLAVEAALHPIVSMPVGSSLLCLARRP